MKKFQMSVTPGSEFCWQDQIVTFNLVYENVTYPMGMLIGFKKTGFFCFIVRNFLKICFEFSVHNFLEISSSVLYQSIFLE